MGLGVYVGIDSGAIALPGAGTEEEGAFRISERPFFIP